ncbi:hypothetical protein [Pseudomonas sp.]|uniref:hypothetical protein n=1 Tax=Pseudomonas sp. TaxID=306 RepID=UPI003A97A30F
MSSFWIVISHFDALVGHIDEISLVDMGLLVKVVGGYWGGWLCWRLREQAALTCTNFEVMVFFTPFTLSILIERSQKPHLTIACRIELVRQLRLFP